MFAVDLIVQLQKLTPDCEVEIVLEGTGQIYSIKRVEEEHFGDGESMAFVVAE